MNEYPQYCTIISVSHSINSMGNSVLVGITVKKTTGMEHVIQVITLFVPHTYLRECFLIFSRDHSGELHNTVVVKCHLRKYEKMALLSLSLNSKVQVEWEECRAL